MARRSQTDDPEALRQKLMALLADLPQRLETGTVGEQVCELVNVHHHLRDLGSSIGASLAPQDSDSGRARLIAYLRAQVTHREAARLMGFPDDFKFEGSKVEIG